MQLGHILSVSLSMCVVGDWGVEMREEMSCKSEERVENYPQSLKNEWKINGCRVLVSTQIPQFWDTGEYAAETAHRLLVRFKLIERCCSAS